MIFLISDLGPLIPDTTWLGVAGIAFAIAAAAAAVLLASRLMNRRV